MSRLNLFLILLLSLTGCSGNKTSYTGVPPCDMNVVDFEILNDDFDFSYPHELIVCGDTLIVCDSDKDQVLHFFDKLSGTYLGSCINKGRGPGEVAALYSICRDGNRLIGIDSNQKKMVIVNLDDLSIQEHSLAELDGWATGVLPYTRNEVILYSGSDSYRYAVYDIDSSGLVSKYVNYPDLADKIETTRSIFDYSGFHAINPSRNRMVCTTYIGSVMEIMSVEDNEMESDVCRYFSEPVYEFMDGTFPPMVIPADETIVGFSDLYLSDEYIYGLLWDSTIFEMESMAVRPKIIAFDYAGNPKWGVESAEGIISSFAFDEITDDIYAIVLDESWDYYIAKWQNEIE